MHLGPSTMCVINIDQYLFLAFSPLPNRSGIPIEKMLQN